MSTPMSFPCPPITTVGGRLRGQASGAGIPTGPPSCHSRRPPLVIPAGTLLSSPPVSPSCHSRRSLAGIQYLSGNTTGMTGYGLNCNRSCNPEDVDTLPSAPTITPSTPGRRSIRAMPFSGPITKIPVSRPSASTPLRATMVTL